MNLLTTILDASPRRTVVTMKADDVIELVFPNDYSLSIGFGSRHYCSKRLTMFADATINDIDSVELYAFNRYGDALSICDKGNGGIFGFASEYDLRDVIASVSNFTK